MPRGWTILAIFAAVGCGARHHDPDCEGVACTDVGDGDADGDADGDTPVCPAGFVLEGGSCVDVDECAESAPCDPHATCSNELGSFSCTCDPGWAGDGLSCAEPAPCDSTLHVYDHAAAPYSITVRGRCNTMHVQAWGGGGAGGSADVAQAHGGGGAYAEASFSVRAGDVLAVHVAGGGRMTLVPNFPHSSGGGGGASYLERGGEILVLAAGGGGGGTDGCGGCRVDSAGAGGGGGAEEGAPGESLDDCNSAEGDAASGGGGGGSDDGGQPGAPSTDGARGEALAGGDSHGWQGTAHGGEGHLGGASDAINGAGGGGGAGWYGGGGGGFLVGHCGAGGGGGSSHLDEDAARGVLEAAQGPVPGGADGAERGDAGDGGAPNEPGADGRIVIFFAELYR